MFLRMIGDTPMLCDDSQGIFIIKEFCLRALISSYIKDTIYAKFCE